MPPIYIKLKGAPSIVPEEHLSRGKDLLDWVSILDSTIPYSLEFETKLPGPDLGDDT